MTPETALAVIVIKKAVIKKLNPQKKQLTFITAYNIIFIASNDVHSK